MSEEEKKEDTNVKLEEGWKKLEEYYKQVSQKIKENIDKVQVPIWEQEIVSLAHIFDEKKGIEFSTLKLVKCID